MISGQCDKLRERAKELRVLANGPVNEGFPAREKLFEAADAMCQAADLILELRDGLQQANAENDKFIVKLNAEHIVRQNVEIENAKLRDELDAAKHDLSVFSGEFVATNTENAKLRALCRDMYLVVELLDMDGVQLQAHGKDADWRTLKERFGEMGVEVDA